MIFDRTQNDVDTAIRLRSEKVKFDPVTMQPINPEELTESEIATLEKGTITHNTLNRIESKQEELKDLLIALGHSFFSLTTKTWTANDIFNEVDFRRIINNLDKLKEAFTTMITTPKTPEPNYYFQNINDIEKILFDLDFLINNARKNINLSWAIGTADTGLNFTS